MGEGCRHVVGRVPTEETARAKAPRGAGLIGGEEPADLSGEAESGGEHRPEHGPGPRAPRRLL